MKLLLCENCGDIFNLTYKEKKCSCGKTCGNYLDDGLFAIYSGENAIPIGFSNPSFYSALINQPDDGIGERFEVFIIPKKCDTFQKVLKQKEIL